MSDVWAVVSLCSVLGAAVLLTRMLGARGRVEAGLVGVTLFAVAIVLLGYLLSAAHLLARVAWWAAGGAALLAVTLAVGLSVPALRARCRGRLTLPREIEARIAAAPRDFTTRLLTLLALTLGLVALGDFLVIICLEPSSMDVLSHHLARIGFYLQQGHLGSYGADYWAQIVHPKIATVLTLYAYLLSGRTGNTAAIVQFIAYLATMLALYGTARALGATRRASAFAAGLFGLLTVCIMEAATMHNDMVLTAFVAIAVYGLAAYRAAPHPRLLALAATAFALAAGVKATAFAVLPSLLVVAVYALGTRRTRGRDLVLGVAALALALAALTWPAGYGENARLYGHPIGPEQVRRMHTFEKLPAAQLVVYGSRNLLRYGLRFLAFDGLPPAPVVVGAQEAVRWLPWRVLDALRLDLETPTPGEMRSPFSRADVSPHASNDRSYWGVLGFALVWPVVLLALLGVVRATPARVFALAAVVFFLVQAYLSPYDMFRGRYFTTAALFALPPLALLPPARAWLSRGYLALVVGLGCLSALCAVTLRDGTYFFPIPTSLTSRPVRDAWTPSVFTTGRVFQITRERGDLYDLALTMEALVPEDAVVALDLPTNHFTPEHLFFGAQMTRRLVPLHPVYRPALPVPPDADFVVYAAARPRHLADIPLVWRNADFGTLFLHRVKGLARSKRPR